MKAIVKAQRAPGLTVTTVPKPVPGAGEVLIAVRHAGVCGTDLHIADWDAWAKRPGTGPRSRANASAKSAHFFVSLTPGITP